METVKTLENKLKRESVKTLKLEKTVRRNLLKAQSQPTDPLEASPPTEDWLEQLEVDKRQLE